MSSYMEAMRQSDFVEGFSRGAKKSDLMTGLSLSPFRLQLSSKDENEDRLPPHSDNGLLYNRDCLPPSQSTNTYHSA